MRASGLLSTALQLGISWAVTFTSCSNSEIATLQTAMGRATDKAYAVIDYLEANPNGSDLWTTYYGAFTTERYNRVLTAFQKIAPDIATTYSYDCSCDSDVVIASIGGSYGEVQICNVYFNTGVVPATGMRSQWTTIIHESTHFPAVLRTYDNGYGADYCKQIALEDPEKALSTADCHTVFALEVPPYGP
ncbi:Metalloprotease [Xylariaceae sp. FL0016]|nr:Metalloprotease [Xylariaceae sp. FL0016]